MVPTFSIILPCRNQADHIGGILQSFANALDDAKFSFEIIAVPNASTDDTKAVVDRVASADPRIRVATNPAGGWGRSVLVGLREATGAHLCYTNSARTEPSVFCELARRYLAAVADGRELLAKVRRVQRNAPLREIGSLLYNAESRLLFGIRSSDVNGTPKIFSRTLYQKLKLQSHDDLLDLEVLAKAASMNVEIIEKDVPGFRRHGGKSSTGFASAWAMYVGAVRLWHSMEWPLRSEAA